MPYWVAIPTLIAVIIIVSPALIVAIARAHNTRISIRALWKRRPKK